MGRQRNVRLVIKTPGKRESDVRGANERRKSSEKPISEVRSDNTMARCLRDDESGNSFFFPVSKVQ